MYKIPRLYSETKLYRFIWISSVSLLMSFFFSRVQCRNATLHILYVCIIKIYFYVNGSMLYYAFILFSNLGLYFIIQSFNNGL